MTYQPIIIFTRSALLIMAMCFSAVGIGNELPVLNDHLSGVVSAEKEKQMGELLLKKVRAQLPHVTDPLSNEYLQSLAYLLAENSELQTKELQTIIIRDESINAFAMPGGIVATNTGLFRYSENEAELSAVLAHEIAHLSQRHFARMIAEQQSQQITTMGAYLASILVLLTVGAEPGMGALVATQAASAQQALSFSRKNEREADRIGIQTLVNSGINPDAMASFFIKLQQSSQYSGEQVPEYMLSHPVTESRIADARTRSSAYPKRNYPDTLTFHLIKNRLAVIETDNLKKLIEILEEKSRKSSDEAAIGIKYGLLIAYTEAKRFEDAARISAELRKKDPMRIAYLLAEAELEFEQDNFNKAKAVLESALEFHPNNYPLSMLYSETLIRNRQIGEAVYLLQTMSISRPQDPLVWRRLAEAHGLKGHRLGVYLAKAEYFRLYGLSDQALAQLNFALPLTRGNYQLRTKVEARIESIKNEEKELRL